MPEQKKESRKLKTQSAESVENTPTFTAGISLQRPFDPPLESIYYEVDTGNRVRYKGEGKWELIDNLNSL